MQTISPEELVGRTAEELTVIDVRTPGEFRQLHARGARNIPLDALEPHMLIQEHGPAEDRPLYVICRTGGRAANACKTLMDAGCRNVVNIAGGTEAWQAAGLPVVRGQQTISLERQVRIIAGSLVAISGVLAIAVHPYFAGIAAFVGAGLAVAGITDSCVMAMLLAKLPWNRS